MFHKKACIKCKTCMDEKEEAIAHIKKFVDYEKKIEEEKEMAKKICNKP